MSPAQRLKDIFGVDFQEQPDITHLRQFHANNAFCSNEQEEIIGICACENAFSSLDLPVAGLEQLIYLNLSDNESLGELSFEGPLPQLQHLDLSDSQVRELVFPEGFEALTWLDLSRNQLQQLDLPRRLPSLWYADISGNKLSELSLQAPKLQYLYLNSNQLTKLEFPTVPEALEVLQVRDNQLDKLPDNFLEFKALKILFVHGNPLTQIPPTFISEGETENSFVAIKGYLESIAGDAATIENEEVKLILLGNSTAGKTSLVNFLVGQSYDMQGQSSTHGIQSRLWQPEEKLKVNIWDFGGQEFYHATHRLFLTNNAVNLVLFDEATNKASEIETKIWVHKEGKREAITMPLQHYPFSYWLDSLEYFGQGLQPGKTLLIQSKMDRGVEREIGIPELAPYQLTRDRIFRISTKGAFEEKGTFLEDFEAFKEILLGILKEAKVRDIFSAEWVKIIDHIRDLARSRPFISYKAYEELCHSFLSNSDSQEVQIKALTQHLNEIGVILYYPHIEALKERIFIRPNWVTDLIYRVLDYSVKEDNGKFDRTHVASVIEQTVEQTEDLLDTEEILALMTHFQLIFQAKDSEDVFIAPQYLPEKPKDGALRLLERSCAHHSFTLYYPKFLPRSIMTRFICQYGNLVSDENSYWKQGISFEKGGFHLIESLEGNKIRVMSQNSKSPYIAELFQSFVKLHERNPEVQVSVDETHFVELAQLMNPPEMKDSLSSTDWKEIPFKLFAKLFEGKQLPEEDLHPNPAFEQISPPIKPVPKERKKLKVFISYARKLDFTYFKTFHEGIKKFSTRDWDIFSDQNILMAEKWDEMIKSKVESCDFAILLLSQEFLISEYILEYELAEFVRRSNEGGFQFFSVLFSPCMWEEHPDIAERQIFEAYGRDYGWEDHREIRNEQISYAQLVGASYSERGFDKIHYLDKFYLNFVKKVKESL